MEKKGEENEEKRRKEANVKGKSLASNIRISTYSMMPGSV